MDTVDVPAGTRNTPPEVTVLRVLGEVQDAVSLLLATPWPLVDGRTVHPVARADGERVALGFAPVGDGGTLDLAPFALPTTGSATRIAG